MLSLAITIFLLAESVQLGAALRPPSQSPGPCVMGAEVPKLGAECAPTKRRCWLTPMVGWSRSQDAGQRAIHRLTRQRVLR